MSKDAISSVLSLLLKDMAIPAVDIESVAWDQPMFVLRSSDMGRMRAFLSLAAARRPHPGLHVMSHARDESAIRAMTDRALTFHPYPTSGRYTLEGVPAEILERLRAAAFGALVFLDAGTAGEGLDETVRLLAAVDETRIVSYRADGTFGRPDDWRVHRLATAAFTRLVEWYHTHLN